MKKMKTENDVKPYKQDKLAKVPSWLKILLLKFWAAGAAFFFFGVGSAKLWYSAPTTYEGQVSDLLKLAILVTLGLSLVQEFIIKPIVRLMRNSLDDTFYYNVVNLKGIKSYLLNLLYAFALIIPILLITTFLGKHDLLFIKLFGKTDAGLEPFTMGFLYVIVDFIYLFIKNSSISIYRRIKYNKQMKESSDATIDDININSNELKVNDSEEDTKNNN